MEELPDSIHIQQEYLYEMQDDSALLSGNPLGTLWIRYYPTLMQTSMLQSNSESVDRRRSNANSKQQLA